MNILFLNILKKMFKNISPNMDSNFALSINEQLSNLNGSIQKINQNNNNEFALKFLEENKTNER